MKNLTQSNDVNKRPKSRSCPSTTNFCSPRDKALTTGTQDCSVLGTHSFLCLAASSGKRRGWTGWSHKCLSPLRTFGMKNKKTTFIKHTKVWFLCKAADSEWEMERHPSPPQWLIFNPQNNDTAGEFLFPLVQLVADPWLGPVMGWS